MPQRKSMQAGPEQLLYAKVSEKGMFFGLLLLILTYIIYATGIVKPFVAFNDTTRFWSMNVHDYLKVTGIHPGWAWLGLIRYSDFLNFVPIAILAGVTIICFLSIVPVLWKQDDKVFAGLALLEAVILSVAASGILGSGGH